MSGILILKFQTIYCVSIAKRNKVNFYILPYKLLTKVLYLYILYTIIEVKV